MKRSFIFSINKTFGAFLLGVFMILGIIHSSGQVTVSATLGTPGPTPYPNVGAAFTAINAGVHGGAVTVNVTVSGTIIEPAAAILNAPGGPIPYTSVLIKPNTGITATITSTIGGNGTIFLSGASNVTIDGSNAVGGTTRDLTISNTIATGCASIRLSPLAGVGASSNTIKNCKITGPATPNSGVGIVACNSATFFAKSDAPNSNNTVQNCIFTGYQQGVFTNGGDPVATPAGTVDNNWTITGCTFANLYFNGIVIFGSSNPTVTNDSFSNITINGWGPVNAIEFSWTITGATVSGNKINNINNQNNNTTVPPVGSTFGSTQGIYSDVVGAATNISIYNNFISNIYGVGFAILGQNGHGIYIDAGGGYNIDYNSINLNTNQTSGIGTAACICFDQAATAPPSPVGGISLKNNLLDNSQSSGGRYTLYCSTAVTAGSGAFSLIDYNDYVATGGILGNIGGVNRPTIVAMQTGFGGNVNSVTLAPTWVSSTDLHLQLIAANFSIVAGNPIVAPPITTDIDGVNRSTGVPTIGAHELPNKITYTNLLATCLTGDVTLVTVNIFCPLGVPLAGSFMPRIYFKKGAGTWFSTPGTLIGGTASIGSWSFTISAAAMGGVVGGDIISYYVVAQTIAATPTVFSNPIPGLVATDVNTVTTPPTAPPTYTVNAVSLTGLATSHQVCYDASLPQAVTYAYTGSFGAPNQYTLTWPVGGPTSVAGFSPLSSPITVTVPGGTAPNTYSGTLTIKNGTTGCTNTYTITLIVNPLPANITMTGPPTTPPNLVCVAGSITLTTPSTGGGWTSLSPGVATIGPTTGIVTGVAAGTSLISYVLPTGCAATTTVNVVAPPGPITGPTSVCVNTSTTLSDGVPGGVWSSNLPAVASVGSSTGVVTGNSSTTSPPGYSTAVIMYTIVGCSSVTKIVTVYPLPSPITGTSLYVCVGNTVTLSTTATGGTWASADPTIATVGSVSGVVTGISAASGGSLVPISYTYVSTGCISTNTVTVFPAAGPITSSSGSNIVCLGLTITLSGAPGTVPAPSIGWVSQFPGYVSIGTTTGIATGGTAATTSTITYTTTQGCVATTVVTVSTPPATITGNHVICTGYTTALGNTVPGGTWTSTTPAVGTVNPVTGVVSGLTAGTTTISYATVACNAVATSFVVTVNQTPPPITGITNLCNGYTTVSTALGDPTPGGAWSICCGTATISPSGLVSGLTIGSTNVVTYTMPNTCYTIAPIIVDTLPALINGPTHECQYATATMADLTIGGIWSSSNGTIASVVGATGVVTGVTPGTVTLSYTSVSGCYVTKPFTIDVPLPASVSFTYSPNDIDTLCAGTSMTFTAHAVNGGATPTFQWALFGGPGVPGSSSYTYTPTHGDVIRCYMTPTPGFCSAPSPAHLDLAINVYPNIYTSVRGVVSVPMTIGVAGQDSSAVINFLGQEITFFTEVTSGGYNPTYQWYVDHAAVTGATNSTYAREIYDNDTVFCLVHGNPKCDINDVVQTWPVIMYADWLGASNLSTANSTLSLFPNPNTGTFTLSGTLTSSYNEEVAIDVVNVLGQVVYKGTATTKNGAINQKIILGKDLPPGSYMLHVNAAAENQVFHFVVGE